MKNLSTEHWLRAGVSRAAPAGVDRKTGTIHGYSVITKGEAKGHGMAIDDTTLDQVVKLGNASKVGMKSRFGHPAMSSDALGTFLGRTTNFRRDGDRVRADLTFDESATRTPQHGDLAAYVMGLAESDPDAFASSIVFRGAVEEPDEDADADALPVARLEKLLAVDVVDEGAANEGMFGYSGQVELSAAATLALDSLLQRPDAVEKLLAFLARYSGRGCPDVDCAIQTEDQLRKEPAMTETTTSAAVPVVVTVQPSAAESFAAGQADAIKSERARIADIRKSAFAGQDALIQKAIEDGLSVGDARLLFIEGKKTDDTAKLTANAAKLDAIRKDTVPALGANPDSTLETLGDSNEPGADVEYDEAVFSAKFDASKELQGEFRKDKKAYLAFCRAMCRGEVVRVAADR
jgi:hypothetical protein